MSDEELIFFVQITNYWIEKDPESFKDPYRVTAKVLDPQNPLTEIIFKKKQPKEKFSKEEEKEAEGAEDLDDTEGEDEEEEEEEDSKENTWIDHDEDDPSIQNTPPKQAENEEEEEEEEDEDFEPDEEKSETVSSSESEDDPTEGNVFPPAEEDNLPDLENIEISPSTPLTSPDIPKEDMQTETIVREEIRPQSPPVPDPVPPPVHNKDTECHTQKKFKSEYKVKKEVKLTGPVASKMTSPFIVFNILVTKDPEVENGYFVIKVIDVTLPQTTFCLSNLEPYINNTNFFKYESQYGRQKTQGQRFSDIVQKILVKQRKRDPLLKVNIEKIKDNTIKNFFRHCFLHHDDLLKLYFKLSFFDIPLGSESKVPIEVIVNPNENVETLFDCCIDFKPNTRAWETLPDLSDEVFDCIDAGLISAEYREKFKAFKGNYLTETALNHWPPSAVKKLEESGKFRVGYLPNTKTRYIQPYKNVDIEMEVADWIVSNITYVIQYEDDMSTLEENKPTAFFKEINEYVKKRKSKNDPKKIDRGRIAVIASKTRKDMFKALPGAECFTVSSFLERKREFDQLVFDRSQDLTFQDLSKISEHVKQPKHGRLRLIFFGSANAGMSFNSPFVSMLPIIGDFQENTVEDYVPKFFRSTGSITVDTSKAIFKSTIEEAIIEIITKEVPVLCSIHVKNAETKRLIQSEVNTRANKKTDWFRIKTEREECEYCTWSIIYAIGMEQRGFLNARQGASHSNLIIVGKKEDIENKLCTVLVDLQRARSPFTSLIENARSRGVELIED